VDVLKTGKILGATMVGLLAGHQLTAHWLAQLVHNCANKSTRNARRPCAQRNGLDRRMLCAWSSAGLQTSTGMPRGGRLCGRGGPCPR
jgi:hypothetical protein